jgi:hypothetical protein
MFEILRVIVAMIVLGIVIFLLYAYFECRHNAKRTRKLARHVREYYEGRKPYEQLDGEGIRDKI